MSWMADHEPTASGDQAVAFPEARRHFASMLLAYLRNNQLSNTRRAEAPVPPLVLPRSSRSGSSSPSYYTRESCDNSTIITCTTCTTCTISSDDPGSPSEGPAASSALTSPEPRGLHARCQHVIDELTHNNNHLQTVIQELRGQKRWDAARYARIFESIRSILEKFRPPKTFSTGIQTESRKEQEQLKVALTGTKAVVVGRMTPVTGSNTRAEAETASAGPKMSDAGTETASVGTRMVTVEEGTQTHTADFKTESRPTTENTAVQTDAVQKDAVQPLSLELRILELCRALVDTPGDPEDAPPFDGAVDARTMVDRSLQWLSTYVLSLRKRAEEATQDATEARQELQRNITTSSTVAKPTRAITITTTATALRDHATQLNTAYTAIDALKCRLSHSEATSRNRQSLLQTTKQRLEDLQARVARSDEREQQLSATVGGMRAELQKTKAELLELRAERSRADTIGTELYAELRTERNRREADAVELGRVKTKMVELQATMRRLSQEKRGLTEQVSEMEQRLRDAEEASQATVKKLEEARTREIQDIRQRQVAEWTRWWNSFLKEFLRRLQTGRRLLKSVPSETHITAAKILNLTPEELSSLGDRAKDDRQLSRWLAKCRQLMKEPSFPPKIAEYLYGVVSDELCICNTRWSNSGAEMDSK